jgi:hypothetical protein
MTGVDVREIDALREWIAALATYREAAQACLSGTSLEIRRGFDWIEERLSEWKRTLKDCEEEVHLAKMDLAARQIPNHDGKYPDTTLQERNLRRAVARRDHCEEKIDACKKWLSRLPKLIDESYTGPARRLETFLAIDLANAGADLKRRVDALDRYAELKPDFGPGPSVSGA